MVRDGAMYRLIDGHAGESLVWISRWDTANDAREFAVAVERAFRARYEVDQDRSVSIRQLGERVILVEDVPSSLRQEGLPPAAISYVEE